MFNIDERSSTLPRMGHTIVADEITQSLIIYGGYSFSYGVLGDTWIYDITNRSYVRAQYGSEAAPSPRYLHAGAVYKVSYNKMKFICFFVSKRRPRIKLRLHTYPDAYNGSSTKV